MTLHQLKIFLAVSKHASITKASHELHISEPSVYQQVKALQGAFSRHLYRKNGRGIEITPEGREFSKEAAAIIFKASELEKRFGAASKSSPWEPIIVGGSHVLSDTILAPLISTFKSKYQDVEVEFRTKSSASIERQVIRGKVDVGLITNATESAGLVVESFRREEMVVVVSSRHAFAHRREITMAELAKGPLIIRGRKKSSSRLILDEVEQQGFQLHIFMQCDSAQAVKLAVARGLGLGLLYRAHVESEIRKGELKVVRVQGLNKKEISSYITYSALKPLSPAAQKLVELLRQTSGRSVRNRRLSALTPLKSSRNAHSRYSTAL